jgi:hypothetical protein
MLLGNAGEGAAVDLVRGRGDDAAGDRAQGGGLAILQQGTFADDRAWAKLAAVNPDAEHTVEKHGAAHWKYGLPLTGLGNGARSGRRLPG